MYNIHKTYISCEFKWWTVFDTNIFTFFSGKNFANIFDCKNCCKYELQLVILFFFHLFIKGWFEFIHYKMMQEFAEACSDFYHQGQSQIFRKGRHIIYLITS